MSSRSNKRRVANLFYQRFHSAFLWRSAEEFEWLNAAPVGREFGSPDYDKLMAQDGAELQSNLSSLIKVCSDLADAKTGDVAAEERQVAVTIITDSHLDFTGISADQIVLSALARHISRPGHRHIRPVRRVVRCLEVLLHHPRPPVSG